jgi:hypothetical protein
MSARTIGILQPSYLPWIGYFEQIQSVDIFVFLDDVQYTRDWRNRNRIKTSTGPQWLTVPVHASDAGGILPVSHVRICRDRHWPAKHQRALRQHYGACPWFKPYSPGLFALLQQPWSLLCELNIAVIRWMCECFGIATPMARASELRLPADCKRGKNEHLIAIMTALGATRFYEGAAGRNYIDAGLFASHGLEVVFQNHIPRPYPQRYGSFVSHLSAIDLLFNCGPEAAACIPGLAASD